MKIRNQFYIAIPSFCLIFFPAFYLFTGGRPTRLIWMYYMGLAFLAALAPFAYELVGRWQQQQSHNPREINTLGGLGFSPGTEGLAQKYPEQSQTLELISSTIEAERYLRFRYLKDSGENAFRVIKPSYIHEHRRHTRHEATLCVNGYYPKQHRHVNFSLSRMSEISAIDEKS